MKKFQKVLFSVIASLLIVSAGYAQETQTRVVDEVVAVVNDGVITLSRVKREIKNIVDAEVQQGKDRMAAQKLVEEKQGELIANMINEELLIQKAKELGLQNEIEAAVNQRQSEIMKEYNIRTVEALHAEMEKQGVDPKELLETWRKQATRDLVIQREVQFKEYWTPNGKELKDYYEKNKSKFTQPETISFSELFLKYEGKDPTLVREMARQLLAQLKAGADFAKIVKENADQAMVTQGVGKAEKVPVKDVVERFAMPLKDVKVGGYTDLIELEPVGVVILKVDAREAASDQAAFDERAVRMAMLNERFPAAQKKFMAKLRDDAYIKVSESYRPLVSPILFADERKEKTSN